MSASRSFFCQHSSYQRTFQTIGLLFGFEEVSKLCGAVSFVDYKMSRSEEVTEFHECRMYTGLRGQEKIYRLSLTN